MKKNGSPGALRRASVLSRWQTASKPTPNWCQQFDVVAALGRTQEAHVRHHQGASEIVRQTDAGLSDACLIGEAGTCHHRIDLRQVAVQGQLGYHLECLLAWLQVVRQPQPPCFGIVLALLAPACSAATSTSTPAVGQQLAQAWCHVPGRQPHSANRRSASSSSSGMWLCMRLKNSRTWSPAGRMLPAGSPSWNSGRRHAHAAPGGGGADPAGRG